ncbi:MAG: hypothetical protein IJK68_06670 [Muribaculaceae bacterium]|nr:hypothetical protein [Muribaculaceae bacterium]MBR0025118.1 hypothetical protein [Muribaculaceae bacterium]
MLLELFTFTTFGVYKPNSWDMTSNSFDEAASESSIELVIDPKSIEVFVVDEGESTTALYPTEIAMAKLQLKLDSISKLCQDWDGRGAVPIDPKSIENVKAIAEHQWNWNFKLWQIAPGVNGEIFINFKSRNVLAGIVVGPDTYSYYIEKETLQGESNVPFDGLQVSNLMNAIANA